MRRPSSKRTAKKNHKRAGHRTWAGGNAPVQGGHKGDIMSPEKRSALMSRIKGTNTGPERMVFAELRRRGIRFVAHANELPGRPDLVFPNIKLAIFIDGDFWHGWRFPLWQHKLSEKWQSKIASNRARDQRNFRQLRRMGWRVIRIWEHSIENDFDSSVARIITARSTALKRRYQDPE